MRVRAVLSEAFSSVVLAFRPAGIDAPIGADETLVRSEVVDAFLGRLQIAPVRNSRVINVKFRSSDPRIAADSVNALSHAYIEQNLEFKFLSSKEASDWLADQLEEQRTQVEATEAASSAIAKRTTPSRWRIGRISSFSDWPISMVP